MDDSLKAAFDDVEAAKTKALADQATADESAAALKTAQAKSAADQAAADESAKAVQPLAAKAMAAYAAFYGLK